MELCFSTSFLKSAKKKLSILPLLSVVFFMGCFFGHTPTYTTIMLVSHTDFPKISAADPLEDALREVSTGNKTVILSVINKAYTANNSMLDFFLDGLRNGIGTEKFVHRFLFATLDDVAFLQCRERGLHCYKIHTGGVDYSQDEEFMTPGFLSMMWRRTLFLTDVLARGYDILFSDVDIVWFQSPLVHLSTEDDVQMTCDWYGGNPYDHSSSINAGFFFVRSNNKTVSLFKRLCMSRNIFPHLNEQDMLEVFKSKGVFEQLRLKFRFLETLRFSGFCQKSGDLREVVTLHGNCLRGQGTKSKNLKSHREAWKAFMASGNRTQSPGSWPDTNYS